MPIYEYQCQSCKEIFEEWCRRIDDETIKECPECGKEAKRLISQTSFALKGDGWYVTEYGTMKGKAEKEKAAKTATSSEKKESGKGSGKDSPKSPSPSSSASSSQAKPASNSPASA